MADINELTANAESTIGILENIAGYEPSDIDGDTVELRFEDESGCDTGCDVSIVEQCQNAADVIRALTEALEAAEELNKHLDLAVRKAEGVSEALRLRLERAELYARTLAVKLPPYSFFDFKLGSHHASGAYVNLEAMNKELAKAGIKLQIEGE